MALLDISWIHSKWDTLLSARTTDEMILAQSAVTCLSMFSTALILLWSIISFRDDYTLTASKPMRYTYILSVLFFFAQSLLQFIGINNAFLNITSLSCKIIYSSQLMAYNFAKICILWLFSYRLQLICNCNVQLTISPILLNLYRILCLIIHTLLWSAWIYLTIPDLKPHDTMTTNGKYQFCFPQTFPYSFLAENLVGTGVVLTDIIFSISALILFIIKCYQITKLLTITKKPSIYLDDNNSPESILYSSSSMSPPDTIKAYRSVTSFDIDDANGINASSFAYTVPNLTGTTTASSYEAYIYSDKLVPPQQVAVDEMDMNYMRLMQQLENMAIVMKKSTVLTTICVVSSMFYTIGGSYILRQIGFFLCFDGVIASLSMACFFKFADTLYDFIFLKIEILFCWTVYIICCCKCICCNDAFDEYVLNEDEEYTFHVGDNYDNDNHDKINGIMGDMNYIAMDDEDTTEVKNE